MLCMLGAGASTFHYGSIKIDMEKYLRPETLLSTFHYGSIKISSLHHFYYYLNYLHSTMVLLKYAVSTVGFPIAMWSTFHYGSIKI